MDMNSGQRIAASPKRFANTILVMTVSGREGFWDLYLRALKVLRHIVRSEHWIIVHEQFADFRAAKMINAPVVERVDAGRGGVFSEREDPRVIRARVHEPERMRDAILARNRRDFDIHIYKV